MFTGNVLNQSFEPVGEGIEIVAAGNVVSSFQVVEPDAVSPLVAALTL